MNGGGRRLEPLAAAGAPRRNRLSRSLRQSQTGAAAVLESTRTGREPEFKTPTRISRTKPSSVPVPGPNSPHNDPDLQQDIVWDAASPSPRRSGTRGKKAAAGGAVNISEIVSRIAPEHGRPRVTEPALQQWIGDSAAIPCTPDPQGPRAKRRSPRATGVENLLRLARQLDQNLFQNQDLEEVRTEEGQGPRSFGSEPRPDPGFLQDDLDFLFDGPTQMPSRTPGRGPTQNRPGSASLCGSGPAGSGMRSGPGSVQNQLEDDWENDDLLNDSLVLEMTQNPDRFLVPKLCSTQNPAGSGQSWVAPSVGTRTEKENLDPTWNPDWSSGSGKWVQTRTEQNRFSSVFRAPEPGQMCSLEPESQWFWSDPMNRPGSDGPEVLGHLDSVFRSEPVWDGPSDDLLCEMCEDLENRIQVQTDRTRSDQRVVLQPTHRNSGNRIRPDPAGQAGCSLAAAPVKQPIGRAVFRNRTGSEPSAALRPKEARCFTFRRPCDRVTMATEKGKCSAAEIELKKQQALERRRRRRLPPTGTG
ncbi:ewing's tumor-associated antigen 1 isoform X2 [Xiphophorus hellerii]|uniref:ewing's tumor-associated antigen 1 isoform X2 n=1 Tax=Xiphophorus hellerii TaxID=8084 RepID=UPI0013B3C470|nr:ewing's tumor-associated antigen 1 isoform X2 [Xiphophorus hellerii]